MARTTYHSWYLFIIGGLIGVAAILFSISRGLLRSRGVLSDNTNKSIQIPDQSQTNNIFQQASGVIHLQTPVSGGTRTIDDYIRLSKENNIGILAITDHDNLSYEYAIHPLRWLVKKSAEESSVLNYGVEKYFSLIENNRSLNKDIILIDGVESSPFYYWTGSFQSKSNDRLGRKELTLHNRGKHMLVLGLKTPEAYENLPLIANGHSKYDAYHGNQGNKPYQNLIDYVNKRGGLTFWAHPEAEEKFQIQGVSIHTPSYAESLIETTDYTGFSVLSEGYQKAGKIGGIWDKVLLEYCEGKRQNPVWAIGELDDYGDKQINSIQTVFLINEKSYEGVITALKTGKVYAVSKSRSNPLMCLERFTVEGTGNKPVIKIKISHNPPTDKKVTIKLIRNGKLIKEYNESLPFETKFSDELNPKPTKSYYRLDITDESGGKIISNPIFVTTSD